MEFYGLITKNDESSFFRMKNQGIKKSEVIE